MFNPIKAIQKMLSEIRETNDNNLSILIIHPTLFLIVIAISILLLIFTPLFWIQDIILIILFRLGLISESFKDYIQGNIYL